jgi:hypothetical protein
MNRKLVIFKGAVLSALMFCAAPAWSGTNYYAGTFYLTKYNSGYSDIAIRPYSSYMCFLTKVGVEETDTGGERSTCHIYGSRGWWRLQANTGRSSDNDVSCTAVCYTL